MQQARTPGFEVVQWYGRFDPARVAVEVVTKLEQEFSRAARTSGVAEVLFRDGAEARGESAQTLANWFARISTNGAR